MLAVVKRPHTEAKLFEIKGDIPGHVLQYLKKKFGQDVEVTNDIEETVNIFETNWFQNIQKQITPGEILRISRENSNMTQVELSKMLGKVSRQKISDLEHGRRNISKDIAKKFSDIFDVPVERFLFGIG